MKEEPVEKRYTWNGNQIEEEQEQLSIQQQQQEQLIKTKF